MWQVQHKRQHNRARLLNKAELLQTLWDSQLRIDNGGHIHLHLTDLTLIGVIFKFAHLSKTDTHWIVSINWKKKFLFNNEATVHIMVWSSLAKILSTLSCRGHILFSRRRSASARAIFATLPTPRNATRVRCSFSESSSFSSSTSLPLQIVLAFQLRPLKNYCFWQFPEATITCPISALGLFLM